MNQDLSFPSKIIIKTIHEMMHSLDGGRNWSLTPCVNIGFLSEGILRKQKEQKCFFFIHVSLFFVINSSIHRTLLLRKKNSSEFAYSPWCSLPWWQVSCCITIELHLICRILEIWFRHKCVWFWWFCWGKWESDQLLFSTNQVFFTN